MPRSDADWIEALTRGGVAAQRAALADLGGFLRRTLARGFGGQLSDAELEDLTQESLLRIHQQLDGFEQRSRFTTWAAAIAVNCAYSELRRRRHRHVSLEDAVSHGAAALAIEPPQPETDRHALLEEAIRTALTDRQREALLAKLGGLPLAEIARRLTTTQGAIYKLLHDARRRLRQRLEAPATPGDVAPVEGGLREST